MDRQELIRQIAELAKTANKNRDTKPAAAVLFALAGAMTVDADTELMDIVAQFSQSQIRTLRSQWN